MSCALCQVCQDGKAQKFEYCPTGDKDNAMEIWVCSPCVQFYRKNLPGTDIGEEVAVKLQDAAFADEIDSGKANHEEAVKKMDIPAVTLSLQHVQRHELAMEERYELMTYAAVVAKYNKTPKALKMRCVKFTARNGDVEGFYYKADELHLGRTLVVTNGVSDVASRNIMSEQLEIFKSQMMRMLRKMHTETLNDMLAGSTFTRPPTHAVLLERVEALNDKATSRRSTWSTKGGGGGYAVNAEESGSDDGGCAEEGEEEEQPDEDEAVAVEKGGKEVWNIPQYNLHACGSHMLPRSWPAIGQRLVS